MKKEIKETLIPEVVEKPEEKGFDYGDIKEENIANVMREAEKIMLIARENTKYVFGEQLRRVQEKLAGDNQYNGCFEKWYEALNLKKQFVYDCMDYYDVLVANPDNQKLKKAKFSAICEVAKIRNNNKLQKEVIDKAPLEKMKFKQVERLVNKVNASKEITEEMIKEVMQEDNNSKSSVDKFVKVGNDFIEMLEKQSEDIKQKDIEIVLQLVEKVKNLCFVNEVNDTEQIELNETEEDKNGI